MSGSPTTSPREVVAQTAVQHALEGKLPLIDDYKLQHSCGAYRISSPSMFFRNTPFTKGHVAGVYADFERGVLVYDFQARGSYDPDLEDDVGGDR